VKDWPLAQEADVNLPFKKTPPLNLLLIGGGTRASKVLETILLNLRDPITAWLPGNQLVLPPIAQTGTLILREVGALELDDQCRLLEWMERVQGRTQVVSTSEAPLLPRVRAGAFLDVLYYRLNTVCIDVSA
jgi:Sigma-54 interaction domain